MKHIRGLAIILLVTSLLSLSAGCASSAQTADKLNKDIHAKTAQIKQAVEQAQAHVAAADQKTQAAATQPANPPETNALLAGAHQDHLAASSDLAPIAPAAAVIETKSTQAAAVTRDVQNKLTKERASFWSYKQRLLFWGVILLSVPIAVLVFIFKTNGAGPIFAAVGEIAGNVISVVWRYAIKPAGMALFHVYTLGAAALANVVNRKYDAQQAAQQRVAIMPEGSLQPAAPSAPAPPVKP